MTGLYVNHEDIRQFLAKLGSEQILDRSNPLHGFEHVASCFGLSFPEFDFRCRAAGPASGTGLPLTRDTMFALAGLVSKHDMTLLRNTKRLDLVAGTFGWKADAFMHHLKSTTAGLGRNETIIPLYSGIPLMTIDTMDGGPAVRSMLAAIKENSDGLFLFAGPTASGKSSTLQMTVQDLPKSSSVAYIEDGISPPSLMDDEKFEALMNAVRRPPPQVLVMPELSDARTARAALRMAEQMAVLATIHAGSPLSAVRRLHSLVDGGSIDGLRGAFSQRLVKASTDSMRNRLAICDFAPFEWTEAEKHAQVALPDGHMHGLYADAMAKISKGATTINAVTSVFGDGFGKFRSSIDLACATT